MNKELKMRLKKLYKLLIKLCSQMQNINQMVIAALISLFVVGCGTPTLREDPKITALTAGLDTIDTFQPVDLSDSPPVSVEQATAEVTEQIAEPNESIPLIELTLEEVRAATLANNLDLKIELIDPAIAQRTLDEERARFEATFFGSTSYRASETEAGISSTSNDHETGLEVPLNTGGSVTVGLPFGESDSDDSGGLAIAAVSVSNIQSLLRGAANASIPIRSE